MPNAIDYALGRPQSPSRRATGALNFGGDASPDRVAHILDLPGDVAWSALRAALAAGIGVLLASTTDGGAVSVTLFVGDDRAKGYLTSPEQAATFIDHLRDMTEAQSQPKGQRGAKLR